MPEPARTVVVTGGARGIGLAIAQRFAAAGDRVGLVDLSEETLKEAAASLSAQGHTVAWQVCDVREEQQCASALGALRAALGPVDVLVNNAGITHRSLFVETSTEVLRRVMDVNFFGAVHCTRAALPDLVARRGMLVAISSIAGFAPLVGRTGYAASKHALHGFYDSLRVELRSQGVGVLLVCPCFTDTPLQSAALDGHGERLGEAHRAVAGRVSTPEEVADEVFRATAGRRRCEVLTRVGKASWWVSRVAPRLYARLMARAQRSEFPV